jgi:tetratricopeptide (TPR) repeat protein
LLRDEADYQLHVIDLWYEKQPAHALALLRGLRDRHPRNAHFAQRIAEVEDLYLHDLTASLRSWTALLDAARANGVVDPAAARARAHLGIALQLDRLFDTDLALDHLRAIVAAPAPAPFGLIAQAQLQMGHALDRLGHRGEAVAAYRAALAAIPPGDPYKIGERARAALRNSPNAEAALAYRLSIEGWRSLERGAVSDAARVLSESLALRPGDQVTRYRQAQLLRAQKNDAAALEIYEGIIRARASTPPTFYAFACVDAARLHEQHGTPDRAIDLYRLARDVFGADQLTKAAAERALARLTAAATTATR